MDSGHEAARRWSKRTIVLAAAIAYGVASWLTNIFPLAAAENVEIRLGVVIPIFFGFVYGPGAGFVVGALGNLIGDLATGYVQYPLAASTGYSAVDIVKGFMLHWQIGNGLMGFIPGLLGRRYARYFSWKDQIAALLFTAIGIVCGIGFASFIGMFLDGRTPAYTVSNVLLPAVQVNFISALILVPIVLFNHARLDFRSIHWRQSGLLKRLSLTILVSAALPIMLMGLLVVQQTTDTPAGPTELAVKLAATIALTLGFTVVNSALIVQSISRPLLTLADRARKMESGKLTSAEATELKDNSGHDELSTLSSVFGRMAHEVIQREERLRTQVQQLQIEVDRAKQHKQVEEITESDFFKTLADKAKDLRDRRRTERRIDLGDATA